jgi:WD40 repeat protein
MRYFMLGIGWTTVVLFSFSVQAQWEDLRKPRAESGPPVLSPKLTAMTHESESSCYIAFLPDGNRIVVAVDSDGEVAALPADLRDKERGGDLSGAPIFSTFENIETGEPGVGFSPPRGRYTGHVAVYDVSTGAQLHCWTDDTLKSDGSVYTYATLSPDGTLLAACDCYSAKDWRPPNRAEVVLWEMSTGKVRARLHHSSEKIACAPAFLPGSNKLAVAWGSISNREIVVYDASTGDALQKMPGIRHESGLSFTRDSKTMALGYRVWDYTTGELIASSRRGIGRHRQTRLLPGGKQLVVFRVSGFSRAGGEHLVVQDIASQSRSLPLGDRKCWGFAVSNSGRLAATWSATDVLLVDLASWEVLAVLRGHADNGSDIAISPNETIVAATARDGSTRFWDVAAVVEAVDVEQVPQSE